MHGRTWWCQSSTTLGGRVAIEHIGCCANWCILGEVRGSVKSTSGPRGFTESLSSPCLYRAYTLRILTASIIVILNLSFLTYQKPWIYGLRWKTQVLLVIYSLRGAPVLLCQALDENGNGVLQNEELRNGVVWACWWSFMRLLLIGSIDEVCCRGLFYGKISCSKWMNLDKHYAICSLEHFQLLALAETMYIV